MSSVRTQRNNNAAQEHYLDVPEDELLRRLKNRNSRPSQESFLISEEAMKPWIAFFQKPTLDELERRE